MKTITLRYSENFAPNEGTILEHQKLIDLNGYVWYGKLGTPISRKVAKEIVENEDPKILLIHSGKQNRYWAHITEISRDLPPLNEFPEYYRDICEKFKCWFKIKSFEEAPKGIMSQCFVASSNNTLSDSSKHSMSPYFIIIVKDECL
jgi:hypothetical protein